MAATAFLNTLAAFSSALATPNQAQTAYLSTLAAPNQTQAARAAFLSALAAPEQGRTAILSALAAPADCNREGTHEGTWKAPERPFAREPPV